MKASILFSAFFFSYTCFSATRVVPFIGQAKSTLRTKWSDASTAPYSAVVVTCNLQLTNISAQGNQKITIQAHFRYSPNFEEGIQKTYGSPNHTLYQYSSRAGVSNTVMKLNSNTTTLLPLGNPRDSAWYRLEASIPLKNQTQGGENVLERQKNIPQFCMGTITVEDATPNTSGAVIASGSIEYIANSDTNYERSQTGAVNIYGRYYVFNQCGMWMNVSAAWSGDIDDPSEGYGKYFKWGPYCSSLGGWDQDAKKNNFRQILMGWANATYGSKISNSCQGNYGLQTKVKEGGIVVGYPHLIANSPLLINGGLPF